MKKIIRKIGENLPGFLKGALAVSLLCLAVLCIVLVREKLLKNANEMGMLLAESYAMEEENRISVYSMLLELGVMSVEDTLHTDGAQGVQARLVAYAGQLTELLGGEILDPFAVIDGQVLAADPWEGDGDFDYAGADWYRRALDAGGRVVYTDGYQDAITGKMVVTLACALDDGADGNVLAFDILMENFHAHRNRASLPQNSSYYLFDSADRLLYAMTGLDVEETEGHAYIEELVSSIRAGEYAAHDSVVRDTRDVARTVYYYEMSNGWLAVITIPAGTILQEGWDGVVVLMMGVSVALGIAMAGIMLHNRANERKMRSVNESLQILGDSYYAIYRVNYREGTYQTVKGSPDVREQLGQQGRYEHLLEVVKRVVDETTHEEFERNLSADRIRSLIEQGVYDFGGDYRRNFGGTFKWVNIQVLYNRGLYLDEVLLAFREIDTAKRRELQQRQLLEAALAAAEKTVEQKAMFFSNASHDMRTPLNAIIGLSRLAQNPDNPPEKVQDYLHKIERSGAQLLTLVNDVLDMSRLEHGKGGSLDYLPMNIETCLREQVEAFRDQAAAQNKRVEWNGDIPHPGVLCDPARLGQILNNLVSNSLKYSEPGARVTVTLREVNHQNGHGKYQLVVEDTGIGMSEEFQQHLFEPFSREQQTFASRKVTGTGLGMPIVKALVQQMSGELTVRSALGRGTTVTITLPLQTSDQGLARPDKQQTLPQQDVLQGRTVLLAEDNEINMEVAGECLGMMGARVLPAWNGREAVECFSRSAIGEIDVVLMDMQMPELDGCGAAEAIRALDRPDAATVPIVAVTANVFAEDIARTTAAGMNGHIAKPIDFKELQEVLRGLLH